MLVKDRKDATYNGAGHDKRPKGSHRIGFDGLNHCHVVFCILCFDRVSLVIGNVRLFGIDDLMLDLHGLLVFGVLIHRGCWLPQHDRSGRWMVKVKAVGERR